MPPPGPYVPPNQGALALQQGSQQPSPYPSTPNYGAPNHAHKFGQMMNQRLEQAVTTGKPMLNKLGKTISSKLGNKPLAGPPQHLQNYQNYQTYQSYQNQQGQQGQAQGYPQPQNQAFSPQAQQQQWGQQQHQSPPQAPNDYVSPQQSPYQQSNYATPASGHSGQSNYFPQQTNQAHNSQPYPSQQPLTTPGYDTNQYNQSGNTAEQTQAHQAQFGHSQVMQGQPQAPHQHEQQQQNQYIGQQVGVVGSSHGAPGIHPSQISNVSPPIIAQSAPSQWGYQNSELLPSPASQHHPSMPVIISQPYQSVPSPPVQQEQQQQKPWNSASPISPQSQAQVQTSVHSNSPPIQQMNAAPLRPSNTPAQSTQSSTPASQHTVPHPALTEFIAELPADMGNLSLVESRPQDPDPSAASSQYQAFHPSQSQKGPHTPGFTIPRRSLSASTFPLADPWRFADPVTEVPTREFYILADLLFDALDRKFEPKNTGLLEAPKIIGSWVKLTEDATRECLSRNVASHTKTNPGIFSYRNYSAFAKLWSLEGIPHMMVPCQPALTPNWNFNQHSHAQDLKVIPDPPSPMSTCATYMPALNRAGWYKFFFLEIMHAPEDIGDLIPVLCAETYKPGVLIHPDLNKRDKTELPALQTRAAEIQTYAIGRVCEEIKTVMAVDPDVSLAHTHPSPPAAASSQADGNMSPEDMAVRMHGIQVQKQFNDINAWTMLGVPPKGYPGGGSGSLV
jgi:hypothetical protein